MLGTCNFYQQLPAFSDFTSLSDQHHYQSVPSDWYVFVTDIAGSTAAIESGRYQDVNLIGAASITVLFNTLAGDFPYVFGGDGASLLVHASQKAATIESLLALKQISQEIFKLELRVGCVPVATLKQNGYSLEVAKLQLDQQRSIAIFRGGGLSQADRMIKADAKYQLSLDPEKEYTCSFEGLTCRWNQLPNRQGLILAVLVTPTDIMNLDGIADVIRAIDTTLTGGLLAANPVNVEASTYKSLLQCLKEEAMMQKNTSLKAFIKNSLHVSISVAAFTLGLRRWVPALGHYFQSIKKYADFQKYDDTLRMVIDCTAEEADQIEQLLSARQNQGTLTYGLHRSSHAQITCYVETIADGGHIHFVDASDGGYAIAAKQLKTRPT